MSPGRSTSAAKKRMLRLRLSRSRRTLRCIGSTTATYRLCESLTDTWLGVSMAELDMARLRTLADELGFWPATTDPADIERHRRDNAADKARHEAYLREYGPGGPKRHRWDHLRKEGAPK